MTEPRSVRFDPKVARRLHRWTANRPHVSLSGAANQLVDEALRAEEHPGIVFRSGPAGRRAALAAGPDIWEVITILGDVRAAQPELHGHELITTTAEEVGLTEQRVRIAVHYYGAYPDEINAIIESAEETSRSAEDSWHVEQRLLA